MVASLKDEPATVAQHLCKAVKDSDASPVIEWAEVIRTINSHGVIDISGMKRAEDEKSDNSEDPIKEIDPDTPPRRETKEKKKDVPRKERVEKKAESSKPKKSSRSSQVLIFVGRTIFHTSIVLSIECTILRHFDPNFKSGNVLSIS